ncbi:radical SAM protein, partial [Streptomyces rubellomurinus subsp. indigoferus]
VPVPPHAGPAEPYGLFRPDRKGRSVVETVVANMRPIAGAKQDSYGCSVLVMTRRQPEGQTVRNHTEVLRAAELAHDTGCDYFETKAMFDDEHQVVQVPQDILDSVEGQLAEAARL